MGDKKLESELRQLRRCFSRCRGYGATPIAQAAAMLGVTRARVLAMVESGEIISVRVRGERMIPRSELRRRRGP